MCIRDRFVTIASSPCTIGRNPGNDIVIDEPTVSGYHAELIATADDLQLHDLDSTNGTLRNGHRVTLPIPLKSGDIVHFGNAMFSVETAQSGVGHTQILTGGQPDDAPAQLNLQKLIWESGIDAHFQPIIDLDTNGRIGFELLARSRLRGLENPGTMFRIAEQQSLAVELSQACRVAGVTEALQSSRDQQIYLNTHPQELGTQALIDSLPQLREINPDQPLVLEVHESGAASTDFLRSLRSALNDLRIGLAYDDFGAGHARLEQLIEVPPDVLKFDVALTSDLPTAPSARRDTVAGLVKIASDLGVMSLAECVETPEEVAICRQLGFELGQGFVFGGIAAITEWPFSF